MAATVYETDNCIDDIAKYGSHTTATTKLETYKPHLIPSLQRTSLIFDPQDMVNWHLSEQDIR